MQTYETALAAAAAPAVDRASRSGTVASVAMAARAAESEPESNREYWGRGNQGNPEFSWAENMRRAAQAAVPSQAALRYRQRSIKVDAIEPGSRQSYCHITRVGFARGVIGNTLIAIRGGHEYVDG